MQQQTLKRIDAELQTQLTRGLLMPAESNQQQQSSLQDKAAALNMLKNMIAQSSAEAAIGRVVLNSRTLVAPPGRGIACRSKTVTKLSSRNGLIP